MKGKKNPSRRTGPLRQRAEQAVALTAEAIAAMSPEDVQKVMHELHVHQEELKIQNEELRRIQAELQEAHDRYWDLYHQAPVGYVTLDSTSQIEQANQAVTEMFGVQRHELVGRPIASYLAADGDADALGTHLRRVFETSVGEPIEVDFARQDGQPFCVRLQSIGSRDPSGVVTECRTAITDVTEQKRAEETLRASEEKHRRVSESIPVAVYSALPDEDSTNLFVSGRIEELTGYTGEEFMREPKLFNRILHPDDRDRIWGGIAEHRSGKAPLDMEYRIVAKDGTVKWIRDAATTVLDEHGEVMRIDGYMHDITDRKRAEEAMRESEAKYRGLYDSVRDGIGMADLQDNILEANPALLEMLGYTLDELRGRAFYELISDEWHGMIRDVIDGQILVRGHSDIIEAEWVAKDGRIIPTSMRGWLVTDEQGQPIGIGAAIRDITERKRAEEDRRKMEAQLQHSQRLESLGVMAGGIAHDFNNLLTAITGQAFLADVDLPPDSAVRENIAMIQEAAKRATDLTTQMLAYSGRGKFVTSLLDLSTLVADIVHLVRASVSKKANLNLELARGLPPIEADKSQLQQVVMNLVINASEAIGDETGTISISTRVETLSQQDIAREYIAEAPADGTYICLEVSDTGCGMDEQTQATIFDPFFTSKQTGRGLGLASLLGIVRGHHGAVRVESERGAGTTFRILLPAEVGKTVEPEHAKEVRESERGSGLILVVDDEEPALTTAKNLLEKSGFDVVTATDGRQAVEVFRQNADTIRAVVLDATMPEMSGREAFQAIREIRPDARVIMVSGYTEDDVAKRLSAEGALGFLQKPYDPPALIRMLRDALES